MAEKSMEAEVGGLAGVGGEKRIVLIAIDTSAQADYAFEYYTQHLHQKLNEVILFHVSETPALPSTSMYLSAELLEEMVSAERAKAKEVESLYAEKLREHHMSGKIKTVFYGKPGEAIVEQAKKEQANMVVMGTRGLGTLRRTVLGSVSDYVLHHINCPIVICRR